MAIPYEVPVRWIRYDIHKVVGPLTDAKAAVMSLTSVPYQKSWAEKLQEIQLKQEVAGTSRIEGAEFTESELDAAIAGETATTTMTRSQRQARAAVDTYRWIAGLAPDRPIDAELILEIHRRIVTGCDDDHCPPGQLRADGQNVTFGSPRHRGVNGGKDCHKAFSALCEALQREFKDHDVLVQALALHYQFGAMHPFLDGNGRTGRALEALMLQRSGLRDALFIALSNYYYDEKVEYLRCLASVRQNDGDMSEFLVFGLKGIAFQCHRLLREINKNILKTMFRELANDLYDRLQSTRKRVLAKRQLSIIDYLLDHGSIEIHALYKNLKHIYNVKEPWGALVRDVIALMNIKAVKIEAVKDDDADKDRQYQSKILIHIRLEWPTEITETTFFEKTREMPRSKTFSYLQKLG